MASAGVASGRVSSMLVVLAVFAVFPVQQSRAESWREFLLEDEACVQVSVTNGVTATLQ